MGKHSSINRIYRLIWSATHQTWVAASEVARGRGKSCNGALLVTALLSSLGSIAIAAPQGGKVTSGDGSISTIGNTTTIKQNSNRLNLNWQSFNVDKNETVKFDQPSASALAVNRILDSNGSRILGNLNANGQVWLINPNGVLFGKDAQINVGSIVASTLNPEDASIGGARTVFSGNSTAAVVNLGTINAAQGGYVALLGHSVSNQGNIAASGGTVALGAGSMVTLQFAGSSLLGLVVDSNQIKALAENGGLIQADGGQVLLSAGARESLLASVVNNTGHIQVQTVEEHEGKIILLGGMQAGTTNVGGALDASAPQGGNGGSIETSAHTVNVADGTGSRTTGTTTGIGTGIGTDITTASAKGTQGRWLIDTSNFTVAAKGGNTTGAVLGNSLARTDITIQTSDSSTRVSGEPQDGKGDIFINDSVTWNSGTTLTLDARRNIEINAHVDASGDKGGKLALKYGQGAPNGIVDGSTAGYTVRAAVDLQAGQNFSTQLGSKDTTYYTVITKLGAQGDEKYDTKDSLQGLAYKAGLSGNYVLGKNIDAVATSDWNGGAGFVPIGEAGAGFAGKFDGLGHTVSNLKIDRSNTDFVGLFGATEIGSVVRNLGLLSAEIYGRDNVGALVGYKSGLIERSYAKAKVKGVNNVGGLVGTNYRDIETSYAVGEVDGGSNVGGLVGSNYGNIDTSYATSTVSGWGDKVGGLVGRNVHDGGYYGKVSKSYATGTVSGNAQVGGLVGLNDGDTTIEQSYATGDVSGNMEVGLLVGKNQGSVSNSYYFGTTYVDPDFGTTLVYRDCGSACPKDGLDYIVGGDGTGVDDGEASKQRNTYTGFDFKDTWVIYEGSTKPLLRSLMSQLTVTVNAAGSKTYDGQTYGCNGGVFACSLDYTDSLGKISGKAVYSLNAKNAGNYYASASGLVSDQEGYWIDYVSGTAATIDKRVLNVSGLSASAKTYDGKADASFSGQAVLSNLVDGESVNVSVKGSFDNKNAGNNRTVTASYALASTDSGLADNYVLQDTSFKNVTIDKKAVNVTGITAKDKIYDGTTSATVITADAILSGLVDPGDVILKRVIGTFSDISPGSKTVSLVSEYGGSGVDNYLITSQPSTTATITAADTLEVSSLILNLPNPSPQANILVPVPAAGTPPKFAALEGSDSVAPPPITPMVGALGFRNMLFVSGPGVNTDTTGDNTTQQ